jgi:hypothetical protein
LNADRNRDLFAEFFEAIADDPRIGPTHISLYMALLYHAALTGQRNTVFITSARVMPTAKMKSVATYHRTIRQLNEYGYVMYEPSHDKYAGSVINLNR